ncbi:MAG: valine--tRNA ligase, partial [Deltaproteobacteria bacterium]
WPFSTLGWPGGTKELKRFYPTSVLVTGFDILFFWVARMMMMGLKFMGEIPFRDVYIHGLVRDEKGEKYSKTRGNVVDPLDLIERFGADALRFTLTALTMPGSDLKLSEARTEGYRHFANKIWNASRFVLMNLDGFDLGETDKNFPPEEFSLPDRWIRSRLSQVIRQVEASLDAYAFNEAAHVLYQFICHEFCDWYLELAKLSLYQEADRKRRTLTQQTLLEVLDAILRLLHPLMPFITEEIWQQLPQREEGESIMVAEFPKPDDRYGSEEIANTMQVVIEVVTALRNIRGEMNLPPGEQIVALLRVRSREMEERLRDNEPFIQALGRVGELTLGQDLEKPLYSAFAVVRGVEIFVPMDRSRMEEEMRRLQKEILKVEKEIAFVGRKLSNEQFVAKAPPEVVEEEREKASRHEAVRKRLEENLRKIKEALG